MIKAKPAPGSSVPAAPAQTEGQGPPLLPPGTSHHPEQSGIKEASQVAPGPPHPPCLDWIYKLTVSDLVGPDLTAERRGYTEAGLSSKAPSLLFFLFYCLYTLRDSLGLSKVTDPAVQGRAQV